jgi:O-antigen/teichoic acid export membrane protein
LRLPKRDSIHDSDVRGEAAESLQPIVEECQESMTGWRQYRSTAASVLRKAIPWASKSGFAMMDQGFISGSNFLLSIILARWMGADQYGAYALAFSIFVLLSLLYMSMVLEPMAVLGAATYRGSLRGYLKSLLWIHVALTVVIFVMLGMSSTAAALWGHSPGLAGALAGVMLASPCVLLFWLARRSFYLELSPASAGVGAVLYCAVALAGLYIIRWSGRLSPFSAFLPMAVAALFTTVLLYYRLRPSLRPASLEVRTGEVWRRHWGYGRWALASSIASWVPAYIYYPLLTSFSGMSHSGELKALMNLVAPMQQTQAALSMLFLPYAARVYGQKGKGAVGAITRRVTMMSLAASAIYWAFVIPFRGPVFHALYGGRYMEVAYLIPAVAIGAVLWSGASGSSIVLRAMGSPASVFAAFIASGIISLAVGIPACRYYGIVGAVWGMNLADAGALLMVGMLLRRKSGFHSGWQWSVGKRIAQPVDVSHRCPEPPVPVSSL